MAMTKEKKSLYNCWYRMLHKKCYGSPDKVCNEWHEFKEFYNWAVENGGDKEGATLTQIDKNKSFCPENCYWDLRGFKVLIDGELLTVKEVTKRYGINKGTILARINKGLTGNDLLKRSHKRVVEVDGEKLTIEEAANRFNINKNTLENRYLMGKRGKALIAGKYLREK